MSASNMYGRCRDGQAYLTREADANAVGDTFKDVLANTPFSFLGGFVPDTLTVNAIRQCPGAVTDHTTPYRQTYVLIALAVALLALYISLPKN
jgi:hypothetical protein